MARGTGEPSSLPGQRRLEEAAHVRRRCERRAQRGGTTHVVVRYRQRGTCGATSLSARPADATRQGGGVVSIEAMMWAKRQRLKSVGGTVAHRAILMVLADYA